MASIYYWLYFVIEDAPVGFDSVLISIYFTLLMVSLYAWKKFLDKNGTKRLFLLGIIGLIGGCLIAYFQHSIIGAIFVISFMGISFGAVMLCTSVMFADVCDEYKYINNRQYESTLAGINTFFNNFPNISQIGLFWLIHKISLFQTIYLYCTLCREEGIYILKYKADSTSYRR